MRLTVKHNNQWLMLWAILASPYPVSRVSKRERWSREESLFMANKDTITKAHQSG